MRTQWDSVGTNVRKSQKCRKSEKFQVQRAEFAPFSVRPTCCVISGFYFNMTQPCAIGLHTTKHSNTGIYQVQYLSVPCMHIRARPRALRRIPRMEAWFLWAPSRVDLAPPDDPRYAQRSFGSIRIALDVNFAGQKIQSYHCSV